MRDQRIGFGQLGFAAVILTTAASSLGFVAPAPDAEVRSYKVLVGTRVLRPSVMPATLDRSRRYAPNAKVIIKADALTGAPRLITGDLQSTSPLDGQTATIDDYVRAAQRYVEDHAQSLGLSMVDLVLDRDAVLLAKDVQFLKFRVHRAGLAVRDGTVDFRFQAGKLVQVANQSFSEATFDEKPSLAGLEREAERAVIGSGAEAIGEHFRIVETDKGYALLRVSEFNVVAQDDKNFTVSVEQASARVFEIRPTQFFLDGTVSGSVYPRYYGETAVTLPYRDATLSYSGGRITADANGAFTGAPNDAQPKLDGFQGTRIKISPQTGAKVVVKGVAQGAAWNVDFRKGDAAAAEDKDMAQSMTYYHLNKEINHVKQFISLAWLDDQLTAKVNLAQSCNAFWDGSSVNLFSAGNGCANTALIADVFYHEWGHGLDANTGGIEDGAFSEGYADTMSLMMTHSNIIGKGFKVVDGSPVRDLTTILTYPKDAHQEIHREGLIIGGSFWDLFSSLKATYGEDKAGDMLSNFALKVIFTASKYTDVYDALLVIDGAASGRADKTPNFCAINNAFAHHGLATADASCD